MMIKCIIVIRICAIYYAATAATVLFIIENKDNCFYFYYFYFFLLVILRAYYLSVCASTILRTHAYSHGHFKVTKSALNSDLERALRIYYN